MRFFVVVVSQVNCLVMMYYTSRNNHSLKVDAILTRKPVLLIFVDVCLQFS